MGKMTRRSAPKKSNPTPAVVADLPVETPETIEEIQPEARHRKGSGLPPDKFSMICGQCNCECAVHIKDPENYTQSQIAQLFVDRNGSWNPPLCGFCKRKADMASGKYKPRYEPSDYQRPIQEAPAA